MNLPRRKPKPYEAERERLLKHIATLIPHSPEYKEVMARINELDKILNRTTELKKTVIPTLAAGGGIIGIYALQQFAGVLVPKALETLAARQEQKKSKESEHF